jgi:superfamily II DNA/RNA helicase
LAAQVAENFEIYGKNHKLNMALLIGGVSFPDQERALERGADVLIATPGRLLDHVERGGILLNDVKILVIDEADRMLDMGFIPDVERIVGLLVADAPDAVLLGHHAAGDPPSGRPLPQQPQGSEPCRRRPRRAPTSSRAWSSCRSREARGAARPDQEPGRQERHRFCNRKRDVRLAARSLKKHGFNAGALHGDMSQPARMETLERFKQGEIQILVAPTSPPAASTSST